MPIHPANKGSQFSGHPWYDRDAFESSLVPARHTDDPMQCADCVNLSEASADENWSMGDGKPRVPKTDEDYAEIAQWAKYYRESGDSRCDRHTL